MLHKLAKPDHVFIDKTHTNPTIAEDYKRHPHETGNYYRLRPDNPIADQKHENINLSQKDLKIMDPKHHLHPKYDQLNPHADKFKTDNHGNRWIPNIQKIGSSFHDLNQPKYHIPNKIIGMAADKIAKIPAKNKDVADIKNQFAKNVKDNATPKQIKNDILNQVQDKAIEKVTGVVSKAKQKIEGNKYVKKLDETIPKPIQSILKNKAKAVAINVAHKIGNKLLKNDRHANATSKIGRARHRVRSFIGEKLANI